MSSPLNNKERQEIKLEEFKKQEMEDIAVIISQKYGLPYINLSLIPINLDALKIIPEDEAKKGYMAAFQKIGKILKIVVKNPKLESAEITLNRLKNADYKLELFIGSDSSLKKAWGYYRDVPVYEEAKYGIVEITEEEKKGNILSSNFNIEKFKEIFKSETSSEKKKISEIFELILFASLNTDASDIHFEPQENDVRLRFRMDGVLIDIINFDKNIFNYLLSRIKLVSELKLNIHDKAQDGRFSVKTKEGEIEIRTSVIPGAYGETIVLRVLNPKTIAMDFENLGIQKKLLSLIENEIKKPNGMILTTGPTGSGKTTTLYAFLKKINTPQLKIITIEDPIEYHLKGISQTQTNENQNYDFANGLKSILRQDPDVIMVGEIRDFDTAETAINASLTGHLVFSTLHTNNASGTIPRLIDLGVKPNLIGPAVNIAIAQRLVRKLCEASKTKEETTQKEKEILKKTIDEMPPEFKTEAEKYNINEIWRPKPCEKCHNTGFKGRLGVFEIFKMDSNVERLISENSTETDYKRVAKEQGMLTMQGDGILKILEGTASFEEIERVVGF